MKEAEEAWLRIRDNGVNVNDIGSFDKFGACRFSDGTTRRPWACSKPVRLADIDRPARPFSEVAEKRQAEHGAFVEGQDRLGDDMDNNDEELDLEWQRERLSAELVGRAQRSDLTHCAHLPQHVAG